MLPPGFAFWRNGHPWIILTNPVPTTGKIVCVNLTSLDDQCADDECILDKTDYAWIEDDHPTAVAFSYAQLWDVQKLDACIRKGLLKPAHPDRVPAKTLKKIRERALTAILFAADLHPYL
jgi:hypothetical protein